MQCLLLIVIDAVPLTKDYYEAFQSGHFILKNKHKDKLDLYPFLNPFCSETFDML